MLLEPPSEEYHNVPFLSHIFLGRPDSPEASRIRFPKVASAHATDLSNILLEILEQNGVSINCFLRMNANCFLSTDKILNTIPHRDHEFEHKNVVVYLTGSGGKIAVGDESYDPQEDDVVLFDGSEHYMQTPNQTEPYTRRIALVATFI